MSAGRRSSRTSICSQTDGLIRHPEWLSQSASRSANAWSRSSPVLAEPVRAGAGSRSVVSVADVRQPDHRRRGQRCLDLPMGRDGVTPSLVFRSTVACPSPFSSGALHFGTCPQAMLEFGRVDGRKFGCGASLVPGKLHPGAGSGRFVIAMKFRGFGLDHRARRPDRV